jgi:uncharacterized membrane-anchored protein YhcB (DUF1043 family)
MINFLKAAPVVFLIGTMVTAILYQKTLLEIWLTIAITFGTTAYHFIMRWVTGEQDSVLDTLREEINDNINRMSAFINNLADNFPKAYGHALTIKSIRMLLSNERRTVKQLINNGMLSEKDAERLLDDIDERTDEINSFSHTFTASFLR